jgi:hypothetical protein
MKYLVLIGCMILVACAPESYTSSTYFDCHQTAFTPVTEQQKLIYAALERAVVNVKDIPDYRLLKDKKNIYVNKAYYSKFMARTKADITEYQFETSEVPAIIDGVRFCMKSEGELQRIADRTADFLYLTFGNIEIKDDVATIGISTGWQVGTKSKKAYVSGGGYILKYKKVNGSWVYDTILTNWIS